MRFCRRILHPAVNNIGLLSCNTGELVCQAGWLHSGEFLTSLSLIV